MLDEADHQRLSAWLAEAGAHPALRHWVDHELQGPDLGAPEDLAWEDCELVLDGVLDLASGSGPVREARVDAFFAIARRLGFEQDLVASLLHDRLRITERRLRAHAVLEVPLDATASEVKQAHRRLLKRFHPDRVAPEDEPEAQRVTSALNDARSVLLRADEEVVLDGADDVFLDDPSWDVEDAPTEIAWEEDGLTDLLEAI